MRLILAAVAAFGMWTLVAERRVITVPAIRPRWAVACGGGAALGVAVGLGWPLSLALVVACVVVLEQRSRFQRRRLARRMSALWPDFLAHVRGRIATGEPLPEAVRAAARSMGEGFGRLDQAWGGYFGERLRLAQSEWADPLADRVLTTLRVAARTGGAHVDAVLATLSASLAEEIRLRRAHEAAVTEQQMTAGVALVAPWVILLLSLGTNPQASTEFATSAGRLVLAGGGAATVLGYVLARRALRLSEPPRVFG